MEIFFGIIIILFCIFTFFLPWINRYKVKSLRDEIEVLKDQITALKVPVKVRAEEQKQEKIVEVIEVTEQYITPDMEDDTKEYDDFDVFEVPKKKKSSSSWEQQLGTKLPVWIGGIAIALAGIFLVKYSIENNLMSPSVRVIIGSLSGVALLFVAHWIRKRPSFSNGERISQSVTGAGIVVLYASIFAASSLYHLIPSILGFIGMAGITVVAILSSLLYGAPIAVLGMLGGFLTPALIGSENPSTAILFVYLYFVFSGLMIIVRKQNWWWLSIPSLFFAFIWVLSWLDRSFVPGDSMWLSLFLMAVSVTIVISSWKEKVSEEVKSYKDLEVMFSKPSMLFNYIGLAGVLLLMSIILDKTGFGMLEWGFMWLLSVGSIILAWFKPRVYMIVPWISLSVTFAMLSMWHYPHINEFALVMSCFAMVYIVGTYLLMFKSGIPLLFAGVSCAAAIGYFVMGWYKLNNMAILLSEDIFWGFVALALSGISVQTLSYIQDNFDRERRDYELLKTVFTVTATAFISLAFFVVLDREWLSVAIAGQVLGMSWINSRVSIKALRPLIMVLSIVFGLLLIPQIFLLVQLSVYSIFEAKLYILETVPIVDWPLFQLGVPALSFIAASRLLLKDMDDRLVKGLELSAVLLVAVMGYYLTRHIFHMDENILFVQAGFMERGVITNVLFAYGLACLWGGRYFIRKAFSQAGMVICAVALFRIVYFDLLIHNPIWEHQNVGKWNILNALLLPYAIPVLWSYLAIKELTFLKKEHCKQYLYGFMLLLSFIFISFEVRQLFHGEFLNQGITSNAEIYTYSAVWLLFGIGLLSGGILKKDKMLRFASLGVISITVGKVFIYDASELEGLYRIFSFLVLGLCLIGLSYFYTRYVFKNKK